MEKKKEFGGGGRYLLIFEKGLFIVFCFAQLIHRFPFPLFFLEVVFCIAIL